MVGWAKVKISVSLSTLELLDIACGFDLIKTIYTVIWIRKEFQRQYL